MSSQLPFHSHWVPLLASADRHYVCFSFSTVCPFLQVLIGNKVPFDLPLALAEAVPLQPIPISQQQIQQATDFVFRRLEQVLVDGRISVEAVRAVLRQRGNSPAIAAASAQELQRCHC